jgi:hypothetical protein
MRTLILLALIAALASCAGSPPSAPRAADSAVIPPSLIPPGYVAADCHLVQPGKEDVQRSKDLNFECTKQTVTNTSRPAGSAPSDAESAPQTQEHDPNGHPVDGCHVTHDHDPNTPDASPVAHVRCTTRTEYGPRMTKTAKCRSPGGKELPPEEYCCSTPAGDPIPHCTPKPIPSGE